MNYNRLEKNIIDIIKEEQIKLGYQKETFRLYYMLQSLNNTFGTKATAEEMVELLEGFSKSIEERLGKPEISHKGDRFCICLPAKATEYVHENTPDSGFLYDLISTVLKHGITIEDIVDIFKKYSDKVHFEKVEMDDFDFLIYFENGEPDDFRYCFKDEGFHIMYHRFLPEDFEDIFKD